MSELVTQLPERDSAQIAASELFKVLGRESSIDLFASSLIDVELEPEDDSLTDLLDETIPALAGLKTSLSEGLVNKRWDYIIGDDTSGRLAALFVKHLADEINPEFKESGHTRLFFVAGGYEPRPDQVRQDLKDVDSRIVALPLEAGSRVLVVTETCISGKGLAPTFKALIDRGIKADLAVVYPYAAPEKIQRTIANQADLGDDFQIFTGDEYEPRDTFNVISRLAAGVQKVPQQEVSGLAQGVHRADIVLAREFGKAQAKVLSKN